MDAKTNYQASAGKPKHLFQGNGFRKQEIMNEYDNTTTS